MECITIAIDSMNLEDLTHEIRRTMRRSARDAVQLGYMLRRVMDERLWEPCYGDYDSYLREELNMDYSMANRFIGINKRFSRGGRSMEISGEYAEFSQGLLVEMLSISPEQESGFRPDMTVKQAREVKRRLREDNPVAGSRDADTSSGIVDGSFRELPAKRVDSEPADIGALRRVLEAKKRDLEECIKVDAVDPLPEGYVEERRLIVGALANMLCELEEFESGEADETVATSQSIGRAPEKPQPELPVLKNQEQRKQWLADYRNWGMWYRDENIDVNYYKYDFADGSRLIVAEYPQRRSSWTKDREDQAYYHLLERNARGYNGTFDKQYVHSTDSETYLIEFLKELQKGVRR